MSFCPSCGSVLTEGDEFCRKCGRSFSCPKDSTIEKPKKKKTIVVVIGILFVCMLIYYFIYHPIKIYEEFLGLYSTYTTDEARTLDAHNKGQYELALEYLKTTRTELDRTRSYYILNKNTVDSFQKDLELEFRCKNLLLDFTYLDINYNLKTVDTNKALLSADSTSSALKMLSTASYDLVDHIQKTGDIYREAKTECTSYLDGGIPKRIETYLGRYEKRQYELQKGISELQRQQESENFWKTLGTIASFLIPLLF